MRGTHRRGTVDTMVITPDRAPTTAPGEETAAPGEERSANPGPQNAVPALSTPRWADGRHLTVVVAVCYAVTWLVFRDGAVSWQAQFGELLGAEAVLAMTIAALLAVGSPRADGIFGGPLHRQRWHRGTALAGLALVVAHGQVVVAGVDSEVGSALATLSVILLFGLLAVALLSPNGGPGRWRGPIGWIARLPYDRWKAVHRLMAVSLLAGMAHGLLNSTALAHAPVLTLIYLAISAVGVAALGYQLVLRRFVWKGAPHRVDHIERVTPDVLAITLRPEGEPWTLVPGQYVETRFAGVAHGPHPFTVIGHHPDGRIQIAVKAVGNDTRALHRTVAIGNRAWAHRPRGDFDHRRGGRRQIWIAGGIGITPFLSWIRSGTADEHDIVDLWYSARDLGQAAFVDEVVSAARRLPWLTVHLVATDAASRLTDGRLTAGRVLAESAAGRDASAFLCGQRAMVDALSRDLTSAGLTGPVFHEAFSYR